MTATCIPHQHSRHVQEAASSSWDSLFLCPKTAKHNETVVDMTNPWCSVKNTCGLSKNVLQVHHAYVGVSWIVLWKLGFEVLCVHCLKGNSSIILSASHPFSACKTWINVLSSLVNGQVVTFASATSAMKYHKILTIESWNTHLICLHICLSATCVKGII